MEQNTPVIDFPLRGEWAILNPPGHHPLALDLLARVEGINGYLSKSLWRWILGKVSVESWFGWSQPVFSPLNGEVIFASDGWHDRRDVNLIRDLLKAFVFRPKFVKTDWRPFAGNYVLIQGDSAAAFLAHLRCGSVKVSTGQQVTSGQQIGEVGNAGMSLAPHLHFQLMNGIDPFTGNLIPAHFRRYERWNDNSWENVQNGRPVKGERIRVK
ncbi:MAG: M23 family metallopeptidase [Nitrospinae bacterium]|nr:M23 family metallopeptidase [Nitrospinota bacterium]